MKIYQQSRKALGSEAIITLVLSDPKQVTYFDYLWNYIVQFEKRFSRFDENSELSYFNQQAGKKTNISPEFRDLLVTCQYYSKVTEGLFNPFILPTLQKVGYRGSWPQPDEINPQLDVIDRGIVSPTALEVFKSSARIPNNTAIEFGGIGKGYLLDLLAHELKSNKIANYWVSLGGDIICAGFDDQEKPWHIELDAAQNVGYSIAEVINGSGERLAIASSGIIKRRGKDWHHIIDPRTNSPAVSDIIMATIVSSSATAADIFATSMIINPKLAPIKSLIKEKIIAQLLQYKDGQHTIIQRRPLVYATQ